DSAAKYAVNGQAAPALSAQRPHGYDAARRLEPIYTATGGGDTDGTAPVAAMRNRHHAGGHSHGSTAAGTARRAGQVPGVLGGFAVDRGFGRRRHAQLRYRGARIRNEAGLIEALCQMRV